MYFPLCEWPDFCTIVAAILTKKIEETVSLFVCREQHIIYSPPTFIAAFSFCNFFFSLAIYVQWNVSIVKLILLPLVVKIRTQNHIHILRVVLYHFDKVRNAAQSFCDINESFGEGTTSKSQANLTKLLRFTKLKSAYTASHMRKEDVNHQGLQTMFATICMTWWTLSKSELPLRTATYSCGIAWLPSSGKQ